MDTKNTELPQLTIAIDGPSGSGKSSVSKQVARQLHAQYFDTGAMYRALAYWCLNNGIDLGTAQETDAERIVACARSFPWEQSLDPDCDDVFVAGHNVTEAIRTPEISSMVSAVSTNTKVRSILVARQQETIRNTPRVVAEGRDLTTVVATNADARILLTASEQVRMRRRGLQLETMGTAVEKKELSDQVVGRDAKDSTVVDFMAPAEGVALVDSSELNFEQTVSAVIAEVEEQAGTEKTDVGSRQ